MPPKVGSSELDRPDELLRILRRDLDVEHVDAGEALEQDALALHHRLAGQGADVPQPEDGRAVGDDRHEVALGGVFVGEKGVFLDGEAGLGDPWRVGQREVALRGRRLRRQDFDLSFGSAGVVLERFFARDFFHARSLSPRATSFRAGTRPSGGLPPGRAR